MLLFNVQTGLSFLLSPHAVRSKWVKRELMYALMHDQYENRIVPLVHKKCKHEKLSWTIGAIEFIDFSQDFDAGCRELLRLWGIGLKTRSDN
ncbi:MAG: TIR domain-containing protein [Planctomycetaceae bacterium]